MSYTCNCGRNIDTKAGFVTHKKYCEETGIETESYKCECGETFSQKGGLTNHQMWCSASDKEQPERDYVECDLCGLEIDSRSVSKHKNSERCKRRVKKQKRIQKSKLCENCGENVVRDYSKSSNGKFCSLSCARSYATKEKREEINERVSKKLSGKTYSERTYNGERSGREKEGWYKECPICKEEFYVTECKKDKIFCSRECYNEDLGNYEYCEKNIGSGGYRENSTIRHSCIYQGQKMDSGAERRFAELLDENDIEWNKNSSESYEYKGVEGKEREYYPDFWLNGLNFGLK